MHSCTRSSSNLERAPVRQQSRHLSLMSRVNNHTLRNYRPTIRETDSASNTYYYYCFYYNYCKRLFLFRHRLLRRP
jgi:hypothetical protein